MSDEKTFLLELREQAQQEWRPLHRALLRDWADEIDYAIKELAKSPTRKNLARLNNYWARGWRYLEKSRAARDGDAA